MGFDRRRSAAGIVGTPDRPRCDTVDDPVMLCPFCGDAFDARDLAAVMTHYDHQRAAGRPAIALAAGDDIVVWDGSDRAWDEISRLGCQPFVETVAFLQSDRTLDVEVADGRRVTVPIGAAVVRRADRTIEVHRD